MNKRKVLSFVVAVAMLVTSLSAVMTANAEVGKHATETPMGYTAINNKADLLAFMNYGIENANAEKTNNYILMADITFEAADFAEGGDFYNDGKAWAPPGVMASYPFAGIFDGNGHTISGLVVKNSYFNEEGNCGFIGVNSGTVKNLHIKNAELKITTAGEPNLTYASAYGGGVVGVNLEKGVVSNCSIVDSNIEATSATVNAYAGGIVGYNSGTIQNCLVKNTKIKANTTSDRTDRTDKAFAGGVCGTNQNAAIWNVVVLSDVEVASQTAIELEGNKAIGAIAGSNNVLSTLAGAYYLEGLEPVGTGSVSKIVAIPLKASEYAVKEYFGSLNFDKIWEMGTEYPTLRINGDAEETAPEVTPKVELDLSTPEPTPEVTPGPTPPIEEKISVQFTKKSVKLKKGKKTTLKVKVVGKKNAKVKFTTSKKKVVKILKAKGTKATVKGMKKGKATITAKVAGKKAKCTVKVK